VSRNHGALHINNVKFLRRLGKNSTHGEAFNKSERQAIANLKIYRQPPIARNKNRINPPLKVNNDLKSLSARRAPAPALTESMRHFSKRIPADIKVMGNFINSKAASSAAPRGASERAPQPKRAEKMQLPSLERRLTIPFHVGS
jgi:hypothetical protein